jgi:hypothetical protein
MLKNKTVHLTPLFITYKSNLIIQICLCIVRKIFAQEM